MKRILALCILLHIIIYILAQPKYEVRAVWLTTIGGIDWPHSYAHDGMGIQEQQQELRGMLDKLKQAGINTVLLQTRVRATTIYPSSIEPWDGCLSGKPGVTPGYDALQFAIDECHRRGMEIHAWVVSIPIGKWNTYGCKQLYKRYPFAVKKIGDEGYLNPESDFTADYLGNICEEITKNYDIDGIHLDYIRYPETWRGSKNKENITRIVRRVHNRVKFYKPWVKMSCSPIGKHDDLSRYQSNGWNARSRVAQDAQSWLREGLMDQLYPMMYFRGNNFYPFAIDWKEQSAGRTIVSGLGTYILHPREGNWPLAEIQHQLNFTRSIGLGGHCQFRAKFLLDNVKGVYDYLMWFDRHPALIPPMTWEHQLPPTPPVVLKVNKTRNGDYLSWSGATDRSDGPYLLYNVYASPSFPVDTQNPANLVATRQPWQHIFLKSRNGSSRLYYAVCALDRYGNESEPKQERTGGSSISVYNDQSSAAGSKTILFPNDGKTLKIDVSGISRNDYILIQTLQGSIVMTTACKPSIDISRLQDGIYQLKTLNKKGQTHRLGFFTVKSSR